MAKNKSRSVFQNNLVYLRYKNYISQENLAEELKLSRASIGSYEEGRSMPPVPTFKKIADFFGVSMEELFNVNQGSITNTPPIYRAY